MSPKHPVLIIGAGIAGLALARVLQEKGILVDVYESSPRDASQGYGITLRSWAYGPLIEQLHVPFEEFCSAVATDGAVGGRGDINPTLHDALTGQPLVQAAPAKTGSPRGGLFRANRNRLRTFLLQGVNCHFDHSLVSLDADGEGNLVTVRFSNGAVATGCVLIGADGVFSKVRRTFLPTVEPSIGSTVVYNGERRVPRETFDSMIAPHMPHTSVFAAVADNAMISLTVTEVTGTEVTITWTYTGQPAGVETPPASESPEGLQSTIVNVFAGLGKMASPFSITLTPDQIRQDRLYHWFMRTIRLPRDGLKQMAARGVVIVGDAAHAMPIFAGEGGNHALVDAVKLGERLSISRSSASIEAFFDDEYPRWLEACDGSEKRTLALHRPLSVWRELAEKAKEHH